MEVSPHMSVGHFLGKDREQGVLFLDSFGQGQIRRLRAVGDIGILFIGMEDELIHIVERHSKTGVHLPCLLKTFFDELGVHQFSDERGCDHSDLGAAMRSSTSRAISLAVSKST